MHVPDGFLDLSTSIATGAISIGTLALAARKSSSELREAGVPLAGLTAVFVFAAQMVNFPVAAGTSGHLLGGALAAVLVGPWTGILCLTVVLGVQALFFADGGLTALGTNVLLMGIVTVLVGYGVAKAALWVLPKKPASAVPAGAIGALVSVPASAAVFVALYSVGGAVPIPLGTLLAAMLGWHLVIGIGEAAITGAVLAAVVATRPDLVYLVRHLRPTLVQIDADGTEHAVRPAAASARSATGRPALGRDWLAGALGVTAVIAGVASLFASGSPDGLEHVAQLLGFDRSAADHAGAALPTADYAISGLGAWSTGLAGLLGVLVVGLIAWALFRLLTPAPASRELVSR